MLNKMLIVFIAFFVGQFAIAQADTDGTSKVSAGSAPRVENTTYPNINRGNVFVGGSFGMGYSSVSGTTISVNPSAEYFLADHFSLGGTVDGTFDSNYSSIGIGPSLTYYFFSSQKWAGYLGANALYYSRNAYNYSYGSDWIGTGKVGLDYFIYPSVAFGPSLSYSTNLSTADVTPYSTLLLGLSVFL